MPSLLHHTPLKAAACLAFHVIDEETRTVVVEHGEGKPIFHNACSPLSFTNKNGDWQYGDWQSTLAVMCALIRKVRNEGDDKMALSDKNFKRDRLFGELLAVANRIEMLASLSDPGGDYHQTNAVRYMQRLQQRPADTWCRLYTQLLPPYMKKLGGSSAGYFEKLIVNIGSNFTPSDMSDNTPIGPGFIEGYYDMMQSLYKKKTNNEEDIAND